MKFNSTKILTCKVLTEFKNLAIKYLNILSKNLRIEKWDSFESLGFYKQSIFIKREEKIYSFVKYLATV